LQIDVEYKPIKKNPVYPVHRKALKRALWKIDIQQCVDLATAEMTEYYKEYKKMKDDEIEKLVTQFEKNIMSNVGDKCPVKRIVKLNTGAGDKDKPKCEMTLELQDELLADLEMHEIEVFVEAISEALINAEENAEDTGEDGVDVKGHKVIKDITKWEEKEE